MARKLEGELALHRPCDRGREQLLLVRPGQFPERRETGRVVVALHPLEREVGPIAKHRLARAPGREFVVVRPRRGPGGGLVEGDVERVRGAGVALGEHGTHELEQL